ncbi:MAG: hypothetical protein AVDCRST_MAG93-8678 [uncultured Chloroflexia bacterium]|uniref:Uncharacterized protein n=1 Tax=uncultured Chloroflexia bacterium TaxID=1672391 RepID=A0A6J4N104_9CHLR|nr:MAG: hypothetical protein AVDCRST_MAG93-8678 [uncultured Chloroflexia bacterium]
MLIPMMIIAGIFLCSLLVMLSFCRMAARSEQSIESPSRTSHRARVARVYGRVRKATSMHTVRVYQTN